MADEGDDYGPLHYCCETPTCKGGRNDTHHWADVDCRDCLRSRPEPVDEIGELHALRGYRQTIEGALQRFSEDGDIDRFLRVAQETTVASSPRPR